jgi:hypothetical protein
MYRAFDVWKRPAPNTAVRYRCFEDLANGKFCVQSSDFYSLPITSEQIISLEKQFLELLLEESPVERSGFYSTIEQAMEAHDEEFADDVQ